MKTLEGVKNGYFILIKYTAHQEAIPVMNFYAPNNIVSKMYKARMQEMQGEIGRATVILEDVNILLSEMDQMDKN